jgi:hypothetical protein
MYKDTIKFSKISLVTLTIINDRKPNAGANFKYFEQRKKEKAENTLNTWDEENY